MTPWKGRPTRIELAAWDRLKPVAGVCINFRSRQICWPPRPCLRRPACSIHDAPAPRFRPVTNKPHGRARSRLRRRPHHLGLPPAQIAQLRPPHLRATHRPPPLGARLSNPGLREKSLFLRSKPTRPLRDLRSVWSRRNLPIRPPEKLTHFWPPAAGRTWALLVRPYPLRAEVCGLLGALSVTVNVPDACPTRIALKRTCD